VKPEAIYKTLTASIPVLPEDKRWAIGITIGVIIFFSMVILAGRVYLTHVDDAFVLREETQDLNLEFALWMIRNDSKNEPIQVNPPVAQSGSYSGKRVYLQREYIAENSMVTLQLRTARRIRVRTESRPEGAEIQVEVLHFKVPSHRPVIVIEPNPNATRTTEIYPDEIHPTKIYSKTIELDTKFSRSLMGNDYSTNIRSDIYSFSGADPLWKITTFDSISNRTESFNGMALFKVRVKLLVKVSDASPVSSGWLESQYFAVDLATPPT